MHAYRFPELHTARLTLRPPKPEDFDAWARFMADDEAAAFLGGAQKPAQSWRGMATMAGAWMLNGFSMFSLIEKETGEWVGRVGPWKPEGWPGSEVGWGVIPQRQGRGYAREAAIASIDWAFEHLGWAEVIHTIDPENTPSIRLAERLGSKHRGPGRLPAPHEDLTIHIWGQTREEWEENRKGLTS